MCKDMKNMHIYCTTNINIKSNMMLFLVLILINRTAVEDERLAVASTQLCFTGQSPLLQENVTESNTKVKNIINISMSLTF